jgi:hypothetical protein
LDNSASVTVDDARKERPDIQIDTSTPEIAAAQPKWWVHRKWVEELYDVRSKVVHKGDHSSRSWGWQIGEHLVMAAHVFPLTVKLMLEKEGHYAPTDDDRGACLATDLLLVEKQWVEDRDGRNEGRSWHFSYTANDDNLVNIVATPALAAAYAINILAPSAPPVRPEQNRRNIERRPARTLQEVRGTSLPRKAIVIRRSGGSRAPDRARSSARDPPR